MTAPTLALPAPALTPAPHGLSPLQRAAALSKKLADLRVNGAPQKEIDRIEAEYDACWVEHRALLAAHRQGRYAALQDALLTLRGEPTEQVLQDLARRLGLDWARLRREMDDPAIARRIEAHMRLAQSLGIQGTPALIVLGPGGPGSAALVPGAVDLQQLERLVAEARGRR
jgi:protein-disulfide isomerase